jgi:hypothetical protein
VRVEREGGLSAGIVKSTINYEDGRRGTEDRRWGNRFKTRSTIPNPPKYGDWACPEITDTKNVLME